MQHCYTSYCNMSVRTQNCHSFSFFRNIHDVDKTMNEIYEQTENLKQIQEALSNPIGQDYDEVFYFTSYLSPRFYFLSFPWFIIPMCKMNE